MKWLNCAKIRLVLIVFVAAIVLSGGGNAKADFTFGEPTNLGPTINTSSDDGLGCLSSDGLEMYFDSERPGGSGSLDLWVTTRPTVSDPWGAPVNLGPTVNSSAWEALPSISSNGLSLFFESPRPGGYGNLDLWVTTRATTDDDWSAPVNLGPMVNSSSNDATPSISEDGLSFFFESTRPGGYGSFDILVTTRTTPDADWSAPVNLGATVNSSAWDGVPIISADGLSLFFQSDRPGTYGNTDIFVTRRATTDDDWDTPVNLGPTVNSSASDAPGSILADGSILFFSSKRPGGYGGWDIWQASLIPIVDLNGDGIVDCADMCIMVDHWGKNYSLCDIGPTPLGDGIVDVQDLIVLAEHLFEEPRLIAYWKLDETEGDIASDSANGNDGTVHGDPAWQPEGGIVDGALQLDGIDDYISTDFVLNPADGAFSVFAWIRGGAPGQVILSQADTTTEHGVKPGSTWLGTDPSEGKFMADLTHALLPLKSDFVITDDQWYDIGLVYDGSSKYLYVDGAEVAKDNWPPRLGADGGLYIGAGSDLEPGAFWSGLIDDVRIYNRAVTP